METKEFKSTIEMQNYTTKLRILGISFRVKRNKRGIYTVEVYAD